MISNLRISGVNLVVLALFAVAGFVAVCWVAAGWAERAADWWRNRRSSEEQRTCWACGEPVEEGRLCDDCVIEPPSLDLPPERTWEQMTSHQLPVTPAHVKGGKPCWCGGQPAYGIPHRDEPPTGPLSARRERIEPLLGSRQATAHFRRLERARKRRWMIVSAEIWRAYEALGLEGTGFTRAMARQVREAAP